MLTLVENLRRAYGAAHRLSLTWMSAETKVVAREKLAAFRPKIGYPDRWRDYSALEVRAGRRVRQRQARGGLRLELRSRAPRHARPIADEWHMTPQTVNAYYNSTFNEIVFPAAILQPPFFDPNADPGGELRRHRRRHRPRNGPRLRRPGREVGRARRAARLVERQRRRRLHRNSSDRLAAQYDAFEPLRGIHVNGRLTLGENIGDNGGLQVSLLRLRHLAQRRGRAGARRHHRRSALLPRLGAGLARADPRRGAAQPGADRSALAGAVYRCNGTVRNMDAWYAAFNVQPGDALYLPENERVAIW